MTLSTKDIPGQEKEKAVKPVKIVAKPKPKKKAKAQETGSGKDCPRCGKKDMILIDVGDNTYECSKCKAKLTVMA